MISHFVSRSLQHIFFFAFSAILALVTFGYFIEYSFKDRYLEIEKAEFKSQIKAPAEIIKNRFENLGENSLIIAAQPETRAYVLNYARDHEIAPIQNQKYLRYFEDVVKLDAYIMQLRLISVPSGKEIIRIDRDITPSSNIAKVPEDQLQVKKSRPYYHESLDLAPGEYYLSNIELNIEHDQISDPPTKVIRAVAPVYVQNKIQAFVVINYLVNQLLIDVTSNLPNGLGITLLDEHRVPLAESVMSTLQISVRDSVLEKIRSSTDIQYVESKYLSYLIPIVTNSGNARKFELLGAAPVGFVDPLSDLSGVMYSGSIFLLLLVILVFVWWLFSSYLKIHNRLKFQTEHLVSTERMHHSVLNTVLDSIIVINNKGIIESLNPATEKLFGYTASEMIGNNVSILMPDPFSSEHDDYLKNYKASEKPRIIGVAGREVMGLKKDGSTFPIELGVSLMNIDGEKKFTGVIRDITERKAYQRKIERQAYYDTVTNLPNRQLIQERLKQELASSKRHRMYGALLFLDLDKFKLINDVHGHAVGDQLLQQAAQRLAGCIRVEDTVGRFGGDEFIVLLSGLSTDREEAVDHAMSIAEKIRYQLSKVYFIDGKICSVGASVGVYLFPDEYVDSATIIQFADMAMYSAKEAGRNRVILFNTTIKNNVQSRVLLEEQMRLALSQDMFFMMYQPLSDPTGKLIGAEALVRWREDNGNIRYPQDFISVAEHTSIISELGKQVIDKSFEAYKKWNMPSHLADSFRLSINLSPQQLYHPEICQIIGDAIIKHQIDPKNVVLEITEGIALFDIEESRKKLMELRHMGLKIAIDDFGSGFSSLNYIRKLPINELKIDKTIIGNVLKDKNERAIAHSIIQLADSLSLSTVAEGVEHVEQLELLNKLGCHYFQGYYFSEPVNEDKIAILISTENSNESQITH